MFSVVMDPKLLRPPRTAGKVKFVGDTSWTLTAAVHSRLRVGHLKGTHIPTFVSMISRMSFHIITIFSLSMLVDSGIPFEPRRSPKNYVRALPLFPVPVLTSCMLVTFQWRGRFGRLPSTNSSDPTLVMKNGKCSSVMKTRSGSRTMELFSQGWQTSTGTRAVESQTHRYSNGRQTSPLVYWNQWIFYSTTGTKFGMGNITICWW